MPQRARRPGAAVSGASGSPEHGARVATLSSPRPLVTTPRPVRAPSVWLAAATGIALSALYAAVSLRRHALLRSTGFDLGIFEQEVRSYASGHWPTSTLKGPAFPLLGDHFSPITAVLAPAYRLFPGPGTLLVAQALLLGLAAMPLTLWAQRVAGARVGLVVGLGFGLSWGIAQAVIFDFHEVAFAVPLLAFSLSALGAGRLRAAIAWAAPLVLVKEDLGLTVAVVGMLVAWRGERRFGLAAAVGGVAATLVEVFVVIPAISPAGTDTYAGHLGAAAVWRLPTLLTNGTKLATLVLVLLPTGFLALRSPLLWVAVPTLAWRLLSDYPAYWGTSYHYSAVLMPVVVAALVDVLARGAVGWTARRRGLALGMLATGACLLAPPPALSSGLLDVVRPGFWATTDHVALGRAVIDRIPAGATVAASNGLAPQLTARDDVSLLGATPLTVSRPDYVVADTTAAQQFPVGGQELRELALGGRELGYRVFVDEDGYLLLAAPGR